MHSLRKKLYRIKQAFKLGHFQTSKSLKIVFTSRYKRIKLILLKVLKNSQGLFHEIITKYIYVIDRNAINKSLL